jgi:uncharacterized membrane protein YcaP (DUF421 family)
MDFVSGIAWKQMFESTVPVLELFLRGTITYLSLFAMLRIVLRRNMRQEYITEEELWSQLREQGVEDLAKVKLAQMEGDGMISVIKRE